MCTREILPQGIVTFEDFENQVVYKDDCVLPHHAGSKFCLSGLIIRECNVKLILNELHESVTQRERAGAFLAVRRTLFCGAGSFAAEMLRMQAILMVSSSRAIVLVGGPFFSDLKKRSVLSSQPLTSFVFCRLMSARRASLFFSSLKKCF